jgi:hypothetical protein
MITLFQYAVGTASKTRDTLAEWTLESARQRSQTLSPVSLRYTFWSSRKEERQ